MSDKEKSEKKIANPSKSAADNKETKELKTNIVTIATTIKKDTELMKRLSISFQN